MATFRDDYQDIFGESGDEEVNDFEGFSKEELDFNSDIEIEEYSETESEDSESENEDEAPSRLDKNTDCFKCFAFFCSESWTNKHPCQWTRN